MTRCPTTQSTLRFSIDRYPSLDNAIEALNLGADGYVVKPVDPEKLLETIRNKLEAKQKAERITKEKLAEWVQNQAKNAQSPDFQRFLEETSIEFMDFGLSKTEARIYVALTYLGTASGIAAACKIRREEIYRIVPKLEKLGIVTRKLERPEDIQQFSQKQPSKSSPYTGWRK